jgi:Phospholipase_D-nuclease N-terminal
MVQNGAVPARPDEAKAARPKWDELPRWQQVGTVALGAAEIVLTTVAVVDLVRRPRKALRGPKALWAVAFAVQPFGPIAYLALGRRR